MMLGCMIILSRRLKMILRNRLLMLIYVVFTLNGVECQTGFNLFGQRNPASLQTLLALRQRALFNSRNNINFNSGLPYSNGVAQIPTNSLQMQGSPASVNAFPTMSASFQARLRENLLARLRARNLQRNNGLPTSQPAIPNAFSTNLLQRQNNKIPEFFKTHLLRVVSSTQPTSVSSFSDILERLKKQNQTSQPQEVKNNSSLSNMGSSLKPGSLASLMSRIEFNSKSRKNQNAPILSTKTTQAGVKNGLEMADIIVPSSLPTTVTSQKNLKIVTTTQKTRETSQNPVGNANLLVNDGGFLQGINPQDITGPIERQESARISEIAANKTYPEASNMGPKQDVKSPDVFAVTFNQHEIKQMASVVSELLETNPDRQDLLDLLENLNNKLATLNAELVLEQHFTNLEGLNALESLSTFDQTNNPDNVFGMFASNTRTADINQKDSHIYQNYFANLRAIHPDGVQTDLTQSNTLQELPPSNHIEHNSILNTENFQISNHLGQVTETNQMEAGPSQRVSDFNSMLNNNGDWGLTNRFSNSVRNNGQQPIPKQKNWSIGDKVESNLVGGSFRPKMQNIQDVRHLSHQNENNLHSLGNSIEPDQNIASASSLNNAQSNFQPMGSITSENSIFPDLSPTETNSILEDILRQLGGALTTP